MLHQFLMALFLFLIFLFVFVIIKVVIPLNRFLTVTNAVFSLYIVIKAFAQLDFSKEITVCYGKFSLHFRTPSEADIELNKLITTALQKYEDLGMLKVFLEDELNEQKNKLLKIQKEITNT